MQIYSFLNICADTTGIMCESCMASTKINIFHSFSHQNSNRHGNCSVCTELPESRYCPKKGMIGVGVKYFQYNKKCFML